MARVIQKRRTAGEGSYHTAKSGYKVLEIELPRGPDGKRRRKRLYGKTTAELQEKRRQFETEQRMGLHADLDRLTMAQLLQMWLEHVVKTKNRVHTYEAAYEPTVRLHLIPHLGHHKVKKLTTAHGQAMINMLRDKGLASRTLRNIKAVLRKALNQARLWFKLKENVADGIEVPPAAHPKHQMLNKAQAQRFLDAIAGHRLEALYWTAILMGLRLGELIGLQIGDVDLEHETMYVRRQIQRQNGRKEETPTKSGSDSAMAIPSILTPILQAQLDRLHEESRWDRWEEHGLMFPSERGTAYEQSNIRRHFRAALATAELPRIRFHDLRHTCGSLLIAEGVHLSVVKEHLRHSQISVTADIYGHVFEEVQRAAAEKIGDLFATPEPAVLELPRQYHRHKA